MEGGGFRVGLVRGPRRDDWEYHVTDKRVSVGIKYLAFHNPNWLFPTHSQLVVAQFAYVFVSYT